MNFAAISLVVLAVVVAIGFIKEVNLGFLSLGAAFVLGTAGGMSAGDICKGFSSSMFATLVGVTYLFGMASNNGTLELFSKKVVALVGKHTVLIPILVFVLSAFISAIGPGHIAAGILLTTFAMYLAFEMKINPMSTALYAKLGANAGFPGANFVELISAITATSFAAAISPLSTGGAIIMSSYTAAKKDTTNEEMNKMVITLFLLSVLNVGINVLMAALGVFTLGGLF